LKPHQENRKNFLWKAASGLGFSSFDGGKDV